jgi:pimeloyl-ACP methyl ester carboxylesterase
MLHSQFTEINGLKIYYYVAGKKENPPLVFLHAWGVQVEWLPPVVEELAKYFYVIAPEHSGLLRSETPSFSEWTFDQYSDILHRLLASLKITSALFVGNSFGGGIATSYALNYPSNVQKLVLLDSVVDKRYKRTWFLETYHALYTKIIASLYCPLFFKKLILKNYLGTPLAFLTKDDIAKKVRILKTRRELSVDYTKLQMPVFLVWGTGDIYIHPIKHARAIARLLPHGKLVEYEGSVPTIYKEPEMVVSLIESILKDGI